MKLCFTTILSIFFLFGSTSAEQVEWYQGYGVGTTQEIQFRFTDMNTFRKDFYSSNYSFNELISIKNNVLSQRSCRFSSIFSVVQGAYSAMMKLGSSDSIYFELYNGVQDPRISQNSSHPTFVTMTYGSQQWAQDMKYNISADFHEYGIEVTDSEIIWRFDGTVLKSLPKISSRSAFQFVVGSFSTGISYLKYINVKEAAVEGCIYDVANTHTHTETTYYYSSHPTTTSTHIWTHFDTYYTSNPTATSTTIDAYDYTHTYTYYNSHPTTTSTYTSTFISTGYSFHPTATGTITTTWYDNGYIVGSVNPGYVCSDPATEYGGTTFTESSLHYFTSISTYTPTHTPTSTATLESSKTMSETSSTASSTVSTTNSTPSSANNTTLAAAQSVVNKIASSSASNSPDSFGINTYSNASSFATNSTIDNKLMAGQAINAISSGSGTVSYISTTIITSQGAAITEGIAILATTKGNIVESYTTYLPITSDVSSNVVFGGTVGPSIITSPLISPSGLTSSSIIASPLIAPSGLTSSSIIASSLTAPSGLASSSIITSSLATPLLKAIGSESSASSDSNTHVATTLAAKAVSSVSSIFSSSNSDINSIDFSNSGSLSSVFDKCIAGVITIIFITLI